MAQLIPPMARLTSRWFSLGSITSEVNSIGTHSNCYTEEDMFKAFHRIIDKVGANQPTFPTFL